MSETKPSTLPQPRFKPLRLPDGTLAGRYDPQRGVLEIKVHGNKYYFDLAVMYNEQHEASNHPINHTVGADRLCHAG